MSNALIELLNEINNELTNQISLVKNADAISFLHLRLPQKTSQCCKNSP
jgi:hypothetical protein